MTKTIASQQHTLAGLDALDPCVIKLCLADISTVLEPSTAVSATAAFAGILKRAALRTFTRWRGWGGRCGRCCRYGRTC